MSVFHKCAFVKLTRILDRQSRQKRDPLPLHHLGHGRTMDRHRFPSLSLDLIPRPRFGREWKW